MFWMRGQQLSGGIMQRADLNDFFNGCEDKADSIQKLAVFLGVQQEPIEM